MEVGVDCGYLGEDRQRTMPLLAAKDWRTQMIAGTGVESKGRDGYCTSFMTAFLLGLGWKRLIIGSDNAPSLFACLARVEMYRECANVFSRRRSCSKRTCGARSPRAQRTDVGGLESVGTAAWQTTRRVRSGTPSSPSSLPHHKSSIVQLARIVDYGIN